MLEQTIKAYVVFSRALKSGNEASFTGIVLNETCNVQQ